MTPLGFVARMTGLGITDARLEDLSGGHDAQVPAGHLPDGSGVSVGAAAAAGFCGPDEQMPEPLVLTRHEPAAAGGQPWPDGPGLVVADPVDVEHGTAEELLAVLAGWM